MAATDQTISGVPGRYASALFDLAGEENSVASTGDQLIAFQRLLDRSEDLTRLVRSPVFSLEDQIGAIEALCARAGIGGLALNFIKLVAKNRRLFAIAQMIKAYGALAAAAKGEVQAEVTSAEKLSDKHVSALKAALKATMGREVLLATRTDQSLLGGLVVKVGSRMVDNSLKTKLANLRTAMKGTG